MIQNKDVINCLPLLASVLGDRYGVQVQIGGHDACTDGKIIRIPALPIDCGKTALALAKGYIDHESAHIRHSDFGVIRQAGLDKSTHYLFNAIEDWRVERRISAIYPGCRQNLDWLIRRFFVEEEDARAGEKSPALGVLSYVLLTVRSWDVAEVNAPRTRTRAQVEKAYPGLAEKLDAVLDRVRLDCPDTAAALEAARELVEIIRAFQPEEPPKEQQEGGGDRKQNGKEQGGHQAPTASASKSEEPEKEGMQDQPPPASASAGADDGSDSATKTEQPVCSDFDGEAQENGDTETGEGGDEAGEGGNGAVDLGAFLDTLDEDSLPRNLGERIEEELAGVGASASAGGGVAVATPGFRVVTELAPEEMERALRCSIALRKRLQGLLQANELRHVAIGRRGKLDDHKLYRLNTANPRVFRREDNQPGQNSAVHILLDCSGSMSGVPIQLARQACYAVAKALEPIKGVNAAVTAFPAIAEGERGVKPLVRHGEKVSNQFGVEGIGGTPLAPALWWVMQNLYGQKEERKIVIIITDGRPDNIPACHAALSRMRALGMEVYGIGIRLPLILTLLPRTSNVIFDLSELAHAVFALLQTALLKGVSR